MKKILSLLVVVMFLFSGCQKAEESSGADTRTADGVVQAMFEKLINETATVEDTYAASFSEISKKIITVDDLTAPNSISRFGENIKYTGIKIISSEILDLPDKVVFKVLTNMEYTEDDVAKTEEVTHYVINEGGRYKYLYKGILRFKRYNMASESEANPIHCDNAMVYTTAVGILMELNFSNDTDKKYDIGNGSGAKIEIISDGQKFEAFAKRQEFLEPGGETKVEAVFPGANSKVTKIQVVNIYTLDENNKHKEGGDGIIYAVSVV